MRAELIAIHVAFDKYRHDPWIGLFTDFKTSLDAIQHELQRLSHTKYHNYKPLLADIVNTLQYRAELAQPTIIRKIRGRTNIKGNDLADTTAKKIVTTFEDIPENLKLTITIGRQAERPPYWVMYTNNPSAPPIRLAFGPHSATFRSLWWTIPEEERLCMHAFTQPSQQLRHKVRAATLKTFITPHYIDASS
jgi:hypothetical protein